jgi:chromosome condensin MukBEF ATPase and DNA-binding subunit MukB
MTRLEEQYTRIEALMRSVDDRLRKVETDIAELKGRVANLPSTWAMITTMLGGQVTLAGFLIAIIHIVGGR